LYTNNGPQPPISSNGLQPQISQQRGHERGGQVDRKQQQLKICPAGAGLSSVRGANNQ